MAHGRGFALDPSGPLTGCAAPCPQPACYCHVLCGSQLRTDGAWPLAAGRDWVCGLLPTAWLVDYIIAMFCVAPSLGLTEAGPWLQGVTGCAGPLPTAPPSSPLAAAALQHAQPPPHRARQRGEARGQPRPPRVPSSLMAILGPAGAGELGRRARVPISWPS